MTIEELRARLAQLATLRTQAQGRVDQALQASFGAARAQTDDERALIAEARAEVANIDAEVADTQAEIRRLEAAVVDADASSPEGRAAEGDADEARRRAETAQAAARSVRVGREPRTYERWDLRTSYLRDLAAVRLDMGSIPMAEARERLQRHAAEVRVELPRLEQRLAQARGGYRDEVRGEGEAPAEIRYESDPERRALDRVDTSGGEFVPPLWLIEQFIGVSRGARVFADLCNQMPLPAGTDTISIPKVATGATTAAQTADNAAVSDTDMTTSSVSASVQTIAGQQDVAMQLLDQSPIAFDQVVFTDLAEDHAEQTDTYAIDGSGASGQFLGVLNVGSIDTTTYTDASPTVPELYPKIADSANEVATQRKRPVTAIVMHPRRWYWMLSAVDSSNRPLVAMQAQGPQNALAAANDGNPWAEGGPVGVTPFGTVYIDPNVPINLGAGTDEDAIILTRPQEIFLWEGPIRTRVLQEVGSGTLTVRFQLFNYAAFMPDRRVENHSIITGTGLITPTF